MMSRDKGLLKCCTRAAALAAAMAFVAAAQARAQVTWDGEMGGLRMAAGVTGSGFNMQYGQRKILGFSAFVDADTKRRIGLEAEGRWLEFHQRDNVHAETYGAGLRYHFEKGRFQPYAKGLAGFGDFNFPYNYASGHYFVFTAGGGLDWHWRGRIYLRAVDFEYQDWPQFTYGAMTTVGVSAGLRVRFYH